MSNRTIDEKEEFVREICIGIIPKVVDFLEDHPQSLTPEHVEINGNIALAMIGGAIHSIADTDEMLEYLQHWLFNFEKIYRKEIEEREARKDAH